MYSITDEQVDFIVKDLQSKGITHEDLLNNLTDHICCFVENEMREDDNFSDFYQSILIRFFKKELREIQEETDNLLLFKHYFAMKKTLKLSGAISSGLLLFGVLFKIMHLHGAGIMMVSGAVGFSLLFIPLLIRLKFKDEEKTIDKLIFTYSFLLGITTIIGSLFKIMHWPGATLLMTSGTLLFIFTYIPLYFFSRFRRAEERFNVTIHSILMLGFGCMILALIIN